MKATYLAAAVAVAVGMSGPAHAAFTGGVIPGSENYNPDPNGNDTLDAFGDQFNFSWQGTGDGSFDVEFEATLPEVVGGSFGGGLSFDEVGQVGIVQFDSLALNDTQVASGPAQSLLFSATQPSLQDGTNRLTVNLDTGNLDFASGTGFITAVPLPAAAWLMIGGLGAIGAYARRARKAAPTAA
ncbi:MAG: VPLPA-CTERM sorting domain-containing protein [Alphaproteobacteria bacterium]|jgi:hypothetical protein|nr:VPLPA-CTERM sorting domain-containing protein [Alphaproteobacteria bacterium]